MTIKLEELKALVALKMCDGIGDVTASRLLTYCGSASAVFEEKSKHLSTIPGVYSNIHSLLQSGINWDHVEKEVGFIESNHINYVSVPDKQYPRLLACMESPPPVLFFRGDISVLNQFPCVSIVGTRIPSKYGLEAVEQIIKEFRQLGVIVISGLAHGIDIAAHKQCIQNNIITFGVVGHGLRTIYPSAHRSFAQAMEEAGGGIISDYFSEELPNRENFPKRNRIIAGLSSATLVIEASQKSGTLITADYALSLKRKVFALPGRYTDKHSEGCNYLLSKPGVLPILSIQQLIDQLNLKTTGKKVPVQAPPTLEPDELLLINLFSNVEKINLDDAATKSNFEISKCASILLNLEMKGLIKSLPGKVYELSPF